MRLIAFLLALSLSAPASALAPEASEASPDRGGRRITSAESYVPMDPIVASVQSGFRLAGLMHIEFGLNAPEPATRRAIEAAMPRLRNAYTDAIARYVGVNFRYGMVPDADLIAERLQEATDHVLGPDRAQVLLAMIIVHDG